MKTIYILALEPLDTRYTGEWFTELPKNILNRINRDNLNYQLKQIDGYGPNYSSKETTPGAFLNFTQTNIWKNNQINYISELFSSEKIQPGDRFLVTDAWHTGIIQLKYMSELMNIPIEIHSIWHAGSYDPNDFLGRKVKDKNWSYSVEKAMFYASDYNYFASNYHIDLFQEQLFNSVSNVPRSIVRSGFPFEYLSSKLNLYKAITKKDTILFPHRVAPEKQVEIFKDLANELPQYKWIVCQENTLTKDEYHSLLGEAKMVFSANLQETLGISMYEGICTNTLPLVPNRLSYKEMYTNEFKYPSEWTISWEAYQNHKEKLKARIVDMMTNYYQYSLHDIQIKLAHDYFSSDIMLRTLLRIY